MQDALIRLRCSCSRANRGVDADRDEDAQFAQRQAFGLDDIDSRTPYAEHLAKMLFSVWVTLTEHKWVTLGERRGTPQLDSSYFVEGNWHGYAEEPRCGGTLNSFSL